MNVVDDCLTESESSSNGKESQVFVNEISDASLFIGDLSREVLEKDLMDAFSSFGDVAEVIVKRSRTTQIPLGYGFVTMKTPDMAQLCVERCQNLVIKGRKICIGKAKRNSSLFISHIDPTITLPALLQLFASYGEVVAQESFLAPCDNPQTTATTAVIKFVSRKEAEEAKAALNGEEVYGSLIKIEWARPYSPSLESDERYETPDAPPQGDSQEDSYAGHNSLPPQFPFYSPPPFPSFHDPIISVYVKYSASTENRVTEEDIKKVFERFGTVTCVSIKTNIFDQDSGLQKGYAFVHYEVSSEGRMSAYQAVNALADAVVDKVRYVTEFSRNFMRLESSLGDTQPRSRPYCGVPFNSTGYGYVYPCPHPMVPRYPHSMHYQSVPVYPPPAPYFFPVPYPQASTLQTANPPYGMGSQESPPSPSSSWSPLEDPVLPEMEYSPPPQANYSLDQQGVWPIPYFPMAYPQPYQGLYPYRPQSLGMPSYTHPPLSAAASVQAYYSSGYPTPGGYSYYTEENN